MKIQRRNRTLIILPAALLCLLAAQFSPAQGLDAPHDTAGCLTCHDMTAFDQPNLIPNPNDPLPYVQVDIDDTIYNTTVCLSCHATGAPIPGIKTHSSLQTGDTANAWTVECVVCHNQHTQEQDKTYGTGYGKFIRTRIDPGKILGTPKPGLGLKKIKFTNTAEFAKSDIAFEGICEACHTTTEHWSKTALDAGNKHFSSLNCIDCHGHDKGMKAVPPDHDPLITAPLFCQGCHGGTIFSIHKVSVDGWINCDYCHNKADNYAFRGFLPLYLDPETTWNTAREKKVLTNGQASCVDCHRGQYSEHVVDTGHGKVHDKVQADKETCLACHYSDVVSEHTRNRDFSCSSCHDRAALGLSVVATIARAITDGMAGTMVYCSDCHNDAHFMTGANTTYVDEHHVTPYAQSGDCTHCHVVGRGIDGPVGGPCGSCHGDSRFAYRHTNAPMLDLDNVQDYRACFSCHLVGAQGYRADSLARPPSDPSYDGTPVVTPMHALPADPMYPGDLWMSDQCGDASCSTGVANLPPCTPNGTSYMCDNFVDMVVDPQGYLSANSGSLTPLQKDAVMTLAKTQGGFGLFDLNFASLYVKNGIYRTRAEIVDGTSMDIDPATAGTKRGNGYGSWAMVKLGADVARLVDGRYEDYFEGQATPFTMVPINFDDGGGMQQYNVLSLDGSGGGGMQTGSGTLEVNLTAKDSTGAVVAVPVDAAWRGDGLSWQSGTSLSGLRPRKYPVEFKKVSGWVTPEPVAMDVTDGATATVASDDSTYVQCPETPDLALTGSTSITWNDPSLQFDYTVAGWPFSVAGLGLSPASWHLDSGGATGFTLVSTGTNSARLQKTGTTIAGNYTFTITARGSDCYGSTISTSIPVNVTPAGALSPTPDLGIGTIGSDFIDTLAVSPIHNTSITKVAGDVYARADCRGILQTIRVHPDGMIDDTVIQSVDLNFLDAFTNRRVQYNVTILPVRDDLFIFSLGREMKTVRVDSAGNITPTGFSVDVGSVMKGSKVYRGPDNVFIMTYFSDGNSWKEYYLRTFQVAANGQISWISSAWKFETAQYYGRVIPDIIHVSGDVFAVMTVGGNTGDLTNKFGRLYTFTISPAGSVSGTIIDSFEFSKIAGGNTVNNYLRMFRLGNSNSFGLLYRDNELNGILKTIYIDNNGTIGAVINTMYLEMIENEDGLDVVPLSNDVYAFLNYRDMKSSYSRLIIKTFSITGDGIIDPVPIDTFKKSISWLAIPEIMTVSNDVYLINGSHGTVYTISIISDQDGDNVLTAEDNCLNVSNPDQADRDADGIGDLCDSCPDDAGNDQDNDGACGDVDICPDETIDDQDGDTLCGGTGFKLPKTGDNDNCPTISNIDQADSDGDGNGDVCEHLIPDTPVNVSPVDGKKEMGRGPALSAGAFTGSGPHKASQWQVSTTPGAGFEANIVYSVVSTSDLTGHTLPPGTLNFNASYYWRVRYQNSSNYWSAYSAETQFSTMVLPAGAFAVWKFDEAGGSEVLDETGNGNNGTLGASATRVAGKVGSAVSLNGTTDYVEWGDDSFLPTGPGSALSVEFRFRSTDTSGYPVLHWDRQYEKFKSWYFQLAGGRITFLINTQGSFQQSSCVSTSANLDDGNWHHVTGVYDDATDNLDLYIDGVLECDGSTPYILGPDEAWSYFTMGAMHGPWYDYFYSGLLDEVVLYNRALTGPEISTRNLVAP